MQQFPFNEDHAMIRDVLQGWLRDWDNHGQAQHGIAKSGNAYDANLWKAFACEQGMAGISIAEEYGGAGLGMLGRAVVMEELGYVLFPSPFFSTCVIAADLINGFATDTHKGTYLSQIAAGETIISFVDARSLTAHDNLTGTVAGVLDGQNADNLLIATTNDASVELHFLDVTNTGVTISPQQTIDPLRAMAEIEFSSLNLGQDTLIGTADKQTFQRQLAISYGALGAESVGGAQRCLDMTLEYTDQRVQFDRKISSFQAVKHRCADMFVGLEASRSAAYYAADTQSLEEQYEASLIAKAYACEAYFKIAGDAIQMHGGIGFTWEYPLHYFFKRARANKSLFHSVEASYDAIATLLEQGAAS